MHGRSVGRFRILEKLGEGGMGTVWKAEDQLLGRAVALKLLPDSLQASPLARERLLREARSTSALSHPAIATLYEAGEDDGRLYLAVAFVDGETVAARVERGALPAAEALLAGAEIADALAHAHARGVLHRDITARNVMLARDGHVVVIDFGVALREHTARITTTGAAVGTLPYLAPELAGGGAASARSDLYALGVVLFEMLTARRPFGPEDGASGVLARRRPEPPSAFAPGLARGVDRLVLQLLARDPAKRPAAAAEVAGELRALAAAPHADGAAPVPRPAPPPPTSSRRWIAVCPFGDAGTDDVLADGLAEAVSAALARLPQLRVVPPAVVRAATGTEVDPCAAARTLGAGLVVRGSVRRSGGRLRVTCALLDARRGSQLAGDTVEGPDEDLFALEDALVASVGRALKVDAALHPRRADGRSPGASAAHETYLRALGLLQRSDSLAMVEHAVGLLEGLRAVEGDSALLHAALGRAYLVLLERTFDPELRAKAEASCRIALELDPHSPDARLTLARLQSRLGRHDEAIASLAQALALRPQDPEALDLLSKCHERRGNLAGALAAAEEMIALRPDAWDGHHRKGMVHFAAGEPARAAEAWRRALVLTPDNGMVMGNLGTAEFQLGRLDEALTAYRRAIEIAPSATACLGAGTVEFFLGRVDEAVRSLERAVVLAPLDARAWGNLGDAQRWRPGAEAASRASFDRAIALVRRQLHDNPSDPERWARLALWLAKRGQAAESLAALRQALSLAPEHQGVLGRAVTVHLLAGDTAEARACLARALAKGYSWVELQRDPELAPLRADPITRRLIAEVELAHSAGAGGASTPGDAT